MPFPGPGLHIGVILDAADLVAAALNELPPDLRGIVEARYLDGDTIPALMNRHQLKRRDLVAYLEAALALMRAALCVRGVRGVADII